MAEQTCKNCGAWYGLHHYETNQCPKNGRETNPQMWEATTYQEEDKEDTKIEDLEAANILLNNTINVQLQVIREHQAADVIAVEAIRAQAEEIAELRTALDNITKTAVTLGNPQSAWEQWRICGKIANQALGRG